MVTRNRISWLVLLILSALINSGCAMFSDYFSEDTQDPPSPLTSFEEEFNIKRVWSTDTGAGSDKQHLKLAPAVTDNKIFVADHKGRVQGINLETGDRLWDIETKTDISAGPGAGNGLVLVGTRNADVLALSISDGKELWRTSVSSEVLSVPKVSAGVVIIRTGDGRIRALDASSGKRLWIYDSSQPVLTLRGNSSPAVTPEIGLVGFDNGKLAALLLQNGRLIWERTIAVPRGRSELERMVDIDGDPIIRNGIVYIVSYQGNVAALEMDSGRLLWTRKMSSYAGLDVAGKQIYITDDQSDVWALDRNSGASLWKQDKLKWRFLTAPVAMGNHVVIADFEGYLHWLSQEDGHLVARGRADSSGFASTPIVVGKLLVAQGKSGELSAFRIESR